KKTLAVRAFGAAIFQLQALWHQLMAPDVTGIFFSTTPPLVGITSCLAGLLRRVPIAFWAMNLTPDQLSCRGKIEPKSASARVLEAANRMILGQSALIVALDRFMQD